MAAKKCSKCGEEKPLDQFYKFKLGKFGRQAECKSCSDARGDAWRKANLERVRKTSREWARRNPPTEAQKKRKAEYRASRKETMREYSAQWYAENKARLKVIRREWYLRNKAKHNAASLADYYTNKDKWRAFNKAWAQTHPEKMRGYGAASDAKRRAAKAGSSGHWTEKDVREIFLKQRGMCAVCRCKLDKSFHRDHIVALASGGSNDKTNLQLLCKSCNSRKHKKDPIRFMQENGYLL